MLALKLPVSLNSTTPDNHVRTNLQEYRRRPQERSGLRQRAGLHRTDLVAAVPEIPRRAGTPEGDGGRAGGQKIFLRARPALPLEELGRAERPARQARPQRPP